MKSYLIILILLLMPAIIISQDFTSLSAKAALKKYNLEIEKANKIKKDAEIQYKKELEESLSLAVKTGNKKDEELIKSILYGSKETKIEADVLPEGIIAIFFEQEQYKGKAQVINDIGKFSHSKLEVDQVRSLKLKSGYQIVFYMDDYCASDTTMLFDKSRPVIVPKGISYQVIKINF